MKIRDIPKYASTNDSDLIKPFIQENSLGTLISSSGRNANHYPFLLSEENGKTFLWTHLSRSNPQWQDIHLQKCLVIFTGPHAYISPTYYINKLNVPTWNYTAVHANCIAEVISDQSLEKKLMRQMVSFYEERSQTDWNYDLPDEFHERLLKAIVWIKLEVDSFDAKFKLSQNREYADYQNIIEVFSKRSSDNEMELLRYMKLTNPFKAV